MEVNRRWRRMAGVALAAAMAGMLAAGCEAVTQYNSSILIDPNAPTLTNANQTVVLTARVQGPVGDVAASTNQALFLPLVWSVSDVALGSVRSSGGLSAIYERRGEAAGNNYVTVRDQGNAEGVAVITQVEIADGSDTNTP